MDRYSTMSDTNISNGKDVDSSTKSTVGKIPENEQVPSAIKNGVVAAVCLALVMVTSYWNAVYGFLLKFWVGSGEFLQATWEGFLDVVGEDHMVLWMWISCFLALTVYFTVSSVYILFDLYIPAVTRPYKIQPGTNEPLDSKLLPKILKVVLINLTIVNVSFGYLFQLAMRYRSTPPVREFPTFKQFALELLWFIIVEEIAFFVVHRLLHTKYLYKPFHKKHHEWTHPVAIAASYCHPVEHTFQNLLPVCLGALTAGAHLATFYTWVVIAITVLVLSHSGYNFPFLGHFEFHDYHHLVFNKNYGVIGYIDILNGTYADVGYRAPHIQALLKLLPKSMHPEVPSENTFNMLGTTKL